MNGRTSQGSPRAKRRPAPRNPGATAVRLWPTLAIVVFLAGCADETAGTVQTAGGDGENADQAVVREPKLLVDDVLKWHSAGPGPTGLALAILNEATQAFAHPCLYNDEPYFNNLQLPVQGSFRDETPAGPGVLRTSLDWTDADYLGTELFLAYRAPGNDTFAVSQSIPRGSPIDVEVTVPEVQEDSYPGWSLWLCLVATDDSDVRVFTGNVDVNIEHRPDPAPPNDDRPVVP